MNETDLGPLADRSLSYVNESQAVLDQMLLGWARQQQARRLQPSTIDSRASNIKRFVRHTDAYPWEWSSADFENYIATLVDESRLSHSTALSHTDAVRTFCAFICNAQYPWADECLRRFGAAPAQIVNEWNSRTHSSAFDGRSNRRMFSTRELQLLFDTADARVSVRKYSGRKGQQVALRDAQMIKTAFAFGLRRRELIMLDVVDLRSSPAWPAMGIYGCLYVRFGKASNGGPPKRRAVVAVPPFEQAYLGLRQWVELGRPTFGFRDEGFLWPSERKGRLSARGFEARFQSIREEAGLPPELTLHSLRHTYITRLQELGYNERFVMGQVGHAYASTTAGYTTIGDEYRRAAVKKALGRMNDLGPRPTGDVY